MPHKDESPIASAIGPPPKIVVVETPSGEISVDPMSWPAPLNLLRSLIYWMPSNVKLKFPNILPPVSCDCPKFAKFPVSSTPNTSVQGPTAIPIVPVPSSFSVNVMFDGSKSPYGSKNVRKRLRITGDIYPLSL
jgi:hypothetical protein